MSDANLIVISVDGLRASALGAYGNTWFGVPALDEIAANATVYSRCLAEQWSVEPLWSSLGGLLQATARRGPDGATVLVTDAPELASHQASSQADFFRLAEEAPSPTPAASADETSSARVLASLLSAVEQTPADQPLLAWAHLRFAFGPWDAPLEPALALLEEDDPTPEALTVIPAAQLDDSDNPDDLRLVAAVRYAAQVMALDACLEATLDALDDLHSDRPYRLAVVGTRGFALGEHGAVGPDERPYNESRHVPLLIREDSGEHRREARLQTLADLPRTLLGAGDHDHPHAVLRSPAGDALQDDHWKLIAPSDGPAELYSKPDDLWEVNDVAVRQPHVVEELQQKLATASATLA